MFTVTLRRWHLVSTIKQSVCARPTFLSLCQREQRRMSYLSHNHKPFPMLHPTITHKHTLWQSSLMLPPQPHTLWQCMYLTRSKMEHWEGKKKEDKFSRGCLPKCPCLRLYKQGSPGDSANVKQTQVGLAPNDDLFTETTKPKDDKRKNIMPCLVEEGLESGAWGKDECSSGHRVSHTEICFVHMGAESVFAGGCMWTYSR